MKQSHGSVAYLNLYMCDLVFINLFWASELMCEIGSARIVIPFHPALYVQTPRFLDKIATHTKEFWPQVLSILPGSLPKT